MTNSLTLDALKAKADALAEEVRAQAPALTIMYAVHHHGQLQNTLHIMEDLILQHPTGTMSRSILKRKLSPLEPSAFLGLAAAQSRNWLGLQHSASMLALISLNVDQYDGFDSALYDLYHLTWQGLEIAELCSRPEMMERLQSKPMVPKRGPMGEAKVNLRGDVFTALMLAAEGYDDAVQRLAQHRAKQVLERVPQARPENFPFILAAESTDFAYREVFAALDDERPRIDRCYSITTEISDATTDDQIRQWWRFCEPAQDMAWRGYDPAVILGAALHTCEDPYVRAIAHQMIGMTGIEPSHLERLQREYNPFMNINLNNENHTTLINEAFQVALAKGLEEDSSKPFLMAATSQNRELTQGRFLGWCAAALQSAGKAFERARQMGKAPEQAAQLEFESHRYIVPLEKLQIMCTQIVHKQREGEIVTLNQIAEMAQPLGDLELVIRSVDLTINDPGYQSTLEAARDLARNLEPVGPAPAHDLQPAPAGPAPQAAPAQMLEFAPGGFSLPPMTTRVMPTPSPAAAASTTAPADTATAPAKAAASTRVLRKLEDTGIALDLAFAEADEQPPATTDQPNK